MIEVGQISDSEALKGLRAKATPNNCREMAVKDIWENKRDFGRILDGNPGIGQRITNANSLDVAFQRQVIMQDALSAFVEQLLSLQVFCAVFHDVPLEGSDKVEVSYFPLQSGASSSFNKTTGYNTVRDWTQQKREVWVGGDGDTSNAGSNAPANTARDRKYLALNYTSYDFSRQPYLNLLQIMRMNFAKLGIDIFTDIVSRVVTAASFGNAAKSVAAASFDADDIADLRGVATAANWPQMGRGMVLSSDYTVSLLKNPAFKYVANSGNANAIQRGEISNAYGFQLFEQPNFSNFSPAGENLVGWLNHKSAVLAAFAHVAPTPEVRALMTRYDVVVDPKTNLSVAYRRFGDATLDRSTEIVESSYGAAVGVESALIRLTSGQ